MGWRRSERNGGGGGRPEEVVRMGVVFINLNGRVFTDRLVVVPVGFHCG